MAEITTTISDNQNDVLADEPRLRDYELTLILSAASDDKERGDLMDKIRALISDKQGEVIEIAQPKIQTLSYAIKKQRAGLLTNLTFRGPTELPKKITDEIKREPALLRHLIIEQPKRKRAAKII